MERPRFKRLLLTGASGQVGGAIQRLLLQSPQWSDVKVMAERIDLTDESSIRQAVQAFKPDIIINPAAFTAVDKAETESATAFAVNAKAPGILAEEAKKLGAALVHFSTDYVFDGTGETPRREDAPKNPLGVYGLSKLEGEKAVTATQAHHLIFRTSWVFSGYGNNFLKTMLRVGAERETLRVVNDQIGAPTSAAFLARMTLLALEQANTRGFDELSGVYHLACSGETSWHGFALEIFNHARRKQMPLKVREILAITTAEYPLPAKRPHNSRLNCDRFKTKFATPLASWQSELAEVMSREIS